MSDHEDEVRALLRSIADDVPVPGSAPPSLLRKISRRRAQTFTKGMLVIGALTLGTAVGVDLLSNGQVPPQQASSSDLVPEVISTVHLPAPPAAVSVGLGRVIVVSEGDGSQRPVDPKTGDLGETAPNASVDVTGKADLVVSYTEQSDSSFAVTVSKGTHRPMMTIPLPGKAYPVGRVAIGPGELWVARWMPDAPDVPGQVLKIDAFTGKVLAAIEVSAGVGGLAVGDAVWVTDADKGLLQRIDPETGDVVTAELGGDLFDVEVGYGSVWVTQAEANRVLRIDPDSMRTIVRIPIPGGAGWLAAGAGGIWSAGERSGKVSLVDPRTNSVRAAVLTLHGRLSGIAIGEGSVWVTNATSQRLLEIQLHALDPRSARGSVVVPLLVPR